VPLNLEWKFNFRLFRAGYYWWIRTKLSQSNRDASSIQTDNTSRSVRLIFQDLKALIALYVLWFNYGLVW